MTSYNGGTPLTAEENKGAIRRFWEGFNTHNLDLWDEACTADFLNHDPGLPTPHADLPTLKQSIGGLLAAFPDMRSSEEALIADGDMVVVRRIFRGTHKGAFMGVDPTDKEVAFTGTFTARLNGGQIEEQWVNFDALGLLRQIDGIPAPA